FDIYKQKITSILILLAIFVAITIIFVILFGILLGGSLLFSLLLAKGSGASADAFKTLIFSPALFLFILTYAFWSIFIGLSFLILAIRPAGTKLKEIFQEAWKKLWQYFWITILVGFFTILSFIFFIIPGLIVAIYLMFCPYILIVEGEKGMNALKRSWNLVKGNWWKVFGRLILLNIVFSIISTILGLVNNLLGTIFQFLCMPLSIIFLYLIYLELKKSKEIQIQTQT
ncbi:MAG: hypothetical protein KAS91_02255, partial [Candidatus Pacebacteria bacterium]|nr:hypothetical protein [Candidatus Paceibacterota bacterium]